MSTINFLITGVGGQGSLLMSNVLSEVGVRLGHDVKKNEVHGMSQRGGSVTSHVRWGDQVRSPVIGEGEVDVLLALEKLEGLRYLSMLRPNAKVLMGDFRIDPLSVSAGADQYPDDGDVEYVLSQITKDYHFAPTIEIAEKLGNSRVHNIVLLGALSSQMPEISQDVWLEVIAERVPSKHVELNRAAFIAGAALFQQKEVAQE
jgi:indolepyruvate ferredoxin oxidoreductase, beta subunit